MKHKRTVALWMLALLMLLAEIGVFGSGVSLSPTAYAAASDNSQNMQYIKNPDYQSPYYIVVYTGSQSAVVYGKDKNGAYNQLIKSFTVSTGKKKSTPTRTGLYKIRAQYRWKTLMGPCYGQYSSSISESYLFHSVPYVKKTINSMNNSYYDNLGKDASHGCIRMCVRDCKWIYDNCPIGTQVRVVNDSGPAGDPVPKRKTGAQYSGWDPTDKWAAGNPYFKDGAGSDETAPVKPVSNPKTYEVNVRKDVSQAIQYGDNVKFTFRQEGKLTYQWYFKKAGQTSWNVWKGRTHSSETVTPNESWNGIQIRCEAKDGAGKAVSSGVAAISFTNLVTVLSQPANVTVKTGANATFTVKAVGAGLTYQWYYKKAGQTAWSLWKGRTHASETSTFNATWDGMQVYCAVRSSGGATVNSNTAKITVPDAPGITKQPSDVTVNAGQSFTMTVAAKGNGLSYQWYYKKAGQTAWTLWKGKTGASVTVASKAGWNGMQVYCEVKDASGSSVRSATAKLTVKTAKLSITAQPKSVSVKTGATAKFTVKAAGTELSYQWYYKKSGAKSWTKWKNKTSATVSLKAAKGWNKAQFYCMVKDGSGKSIKSNAAKLTVKTK